VVLLWQVSHCALVGIWLVDLAFTPVVTPWQESQRPATGGVAVAWLKIAPLKLVVELWQVSHCAVVAMWLVGLAKALIETYDPLWQEAQLPAATGPLVPA